MYSSLVRAKDMIFLFAHELLSTRFHGSNFKSASNDLIKCENSQHSHNNIVKTDLRRSLLQQVRVSQNQDVQINFGMIHSGWRGRGQDCTKSLPAAV